MFHPSFQHLVPHVNLEYEVLLPSSVSTYQKPLVRLALSLPLLAIWKGQKFQCIVPGQQDLRRQHFSSRHGGESTRGQLGGRSGGGGGTGSSLARMHQVSTALAGSLSSPRGLSSSRRPACSRCGGYWSQLSMCTEHAAGSSLQLR
jgi:hypothetical protein